MRLLAVACVLALGALAVAVLWPRPDTPKPEAMREAHEPALPLPSAPESRPARPDITPAEYRRRLDRIEDTLADPCFDAHDDIVELTEMVLEQARPVADDPVMRRDMPSFVLDVEEQLLHALELCAEAP